MTKMLLISASTVVLLLLHFKQLRAIRVEANEDDLSAANPWNGFTFNNDGLLQQGDVKASRDQTHVSAAACYNKKCCNCGGNQPDGVGKTLGAACLGECGHTSHMQDLVPAANGWKPHYEKCWLGSGPGCGIAREKRPQVGSLLQNEATVTSMQISTEVVAYSHIATRSAPMLVAKYDLPRSSAWEDRLANLPAEIKRAVSDGALHANGRGMLTSLQVHNQTKFVQFKREELQVASIGSATHDICCAWCVYSGINLDHCGGCGGSTQRTDIVATIVANGIGLSTGNLFKANRRMQSHTRVCAFEFAVAGFLEGKMPNNKAWVKQDCVDVTKVQLQLSLNGSINGLATPTYQGMNATGLISMQAALSKSLKFMNDLRQETVERCSRTGWCPLAHAKTPLVTPHDELLNLYRHVLGIDFRALGWHQHVEPSSEELRKQPMANAWGIAQILSLVPDLPLVGQSRAMRGFVGWAKKGGIWDTASAQLPEFGTESGRDNGSLAGGRGWQLDGDGSSLMMAATKSGQTPRLSWDDVAPLQRSVLCTYQKASRGKRIPMRLKGFTTSAEDTASAEAKAATWINSSTDIVWYECNPTAPVFALKKTGQIIRGEFEIEGEILENINWLDELAPGERQPVAEAIRAAMHAAANAAAAAYAAAEFASGIANQTTAIVQCMANSEKSWEECEAIVSNRQEPSINCTLQDVDMVAPYLGLFVSEVDFDVMIEHIQAEHENAEKEALKDLADESG